MIEVRRKEDRARFRASGAGHVPVSVFMNKKVWTSDMKAISQPLDDLMRAHYGRVMVRVFVKGRSSRGGKLYSFSQRVRRRPDGSIAYVWKPSTKPQPRPFEFFRRGLAAYKSVAAYKSADGQTFGKLTETGRLAMSYKIKRMSPTVVRLLPTGGRPDGPSNAKVARGVAHKKGLDIVAPTAAEVAEYQRLARDLITPQIFSAAVRASAVFRASKLLGQRRRGLEKLKRAQREARQRLRAQERR